MAAVGAAIASSLPTTASAAFPEKPVRWVIGFPPGSAADLTARIVGQKMAESLGQQVIVDNRPGAGTNIAGAAVARSEPDGYTLFMASSTTSVNQSLMKNVPFDFFKDFSPVGLAVTVPSILVVTPSLGVSSVDQLIDVVKQQPGKVFYASSGVGTMSHLAGELFGMTTGAKMTHVPYQGSTQATTDLLAGSVQVMFAPASSVLPYIKEGKLKALATTGAERSRLIPDLPTVAEAGAKDYDTRIWFGMAAPAHTPDSAIKVLSAALLKALDSQEVKDQLAAQGIEPYKGDPAQFSEQMAKEMKKWAQVVKAAGIKPE
jgi:tripartite-type tricarboxylate transporter receptor subunit TctC